MVQSVQEFKAQTQTDRRTSTHRARRFYNPARFHQGKGSRIKTYMREFRVYDRCTAKEGEGIYSKFSSRLIMKETSYCGM